MKIIDTSTLITASDLDLLTSNEKEWVYNGLDCAVTYEVLDALLIELADDNAASIIYRRSLDLRGPILEMSLRGLRVDVVQRQKVLREFEHKLHILEHQFNRIVNDGIGLPGKINWRSTHQLKHIFYEVLGLRPIRKRNAHGVYTPTVNADALEKLANNFWAMPLTTILLAARELDKRISFLKTPLDPDGKLRSTFNIAGTTTGRLASSQSEFGTGTNSQNIDRSLRTIFIPDPGMKFINIDLEQGDSRNIGAFCWNVFYHTEGAAFAGSYLDACESADLHTTVCSMTWTELDWPADRSDLAAMRAVAEQIFYRQDSYRQTAKKLGHGTNYVGTPPTMAHHTKMPVAIIADFQMRYFSRFQCIPKFHEWVQTQLNETAYIITPHNRGRYFYGRPEDKATLREAVAFGGQSMTADAVNKGMIQLFRFASAHPEYNIQILVQVHDSLLLQVPEERCDELVPLILEVTKAPLTLVGDRLFIVPNEAKVGWNWGDRVVEKDGRVENENGLAKWKGADKRKYTAPRLSISDRLLQVAHA